ncbi:MAG: hypothetical protein QG589_507, partial [Patescibacteria group bacterium]|nr:hypothetical protein [Patescibacteria group bacterium]
MHIVTVIPLSRGISKDVLTYFSKELVTPGSIVTIPVRKKTVYGLVVGIRDATEIKSDLKTLSYNIKKISTVHTHSFLLDSFIRAIHKIANYHASSVGSTLSAYIPNAILEQSDQLEKISNTETPPSFYETVLLQSTDEERYATYKSLVREEFARGKSVFFCLPTTEDLKNAHAVLEKGIEKYAYVLHARLSKKEIISIWNTLITEPHPVHIIATSSFLSIPRTDISTLIIEKESSRSYKMQVRPFIDIRTSATYIAKEMNRRLVFGDTLLRTETLWEHKNGTYAELSPLKFRSLTTATCTLVPLRQPEDQVKKKFALFSTELMHTLEHAKEHNEHVFLFCGRKGLYPHTVCSDCGTVVTCKNCNAPVVLYSKKKGDVMDNLFVCHHCGERRNAQELCVHCGGWRLQTLGIGIDAVVKEIETLFPQIHIYAMDKERVTTHPQAVKIRDTFYAHPGSVMVGTEMALPYLNQKIAHTAVVSLDSFFSIPDFRIHEKIFHILLHLRSVSEKQMLVQTRQVNTKIFDYALRGNLADFYRDEIDERKQVGYPPFVTYIKLTIEGEKQTVKKQMTEIATALHP